jgi:hypothetical protein
MKPPLRVARYTGVLNALFGTSDRQHFSLGDNCAKPEQINAIRIWYIIDSQPG